MTLEQISEKLRTLKSKHLELVRRQMRGELSLGKEVNKVRGLIKRYYKLYAKKAGVKI